MIAKVPSIKLYQQNYSAYTLHDLKNVNIIYNNIPNKARSRHSKRSYKFFTMLTYWILSTHTLTLVSIVPKVDLSFDASDSNSIICEDLTNMDQKDRKHSYIMTYFCHSVSNRKWVVKWCF